MDCNIEELQRLGFPMTTATDADNAHHCDVNAEEMQAIPLLPLNHPNQQSTPAHRYCVASVVNSNKSKHQVAETSTTMCLSTAPNHHSYNHHSTDFDIQQPTTSGTSMNHTNHVIPISSNHCNSVLNYNHIMQDSTPAALFHQALWTQYDSYHGASYTRGIPSKLHGESSPEMASSGESQDEDLYGRGRQVEVTAGTCDTVSGQNEYLQNLLLGTLYPGWKLSYQDFSPELESANDGQLTCKQTFRDLVDEANSWLRQNPQLQLKSCETITWTTSKPILLGDTETVVLDRCMCSQLDNPETFHVTGFRLWVVPNTSRDSAKIVLLSKQERDSDFHPIQFRDFKSLDKESLKEFIAGVNGELAGDWIQGEITCMHCIYVPDFPYWDSRCVLWRESQCRQGHTQIILRIFYRQGVPSMQHIGVRDIYPDTSQGVWDSFSLLMKKATSWIRKETSVYVTNLQSLYVDRKQLEDTAKSSSEKGCKSFRNFHTQQCFQVLRLYYIKRPTQDCSSINSSQSQQATQQSHHVINCMTFTPVQTTLGPNIEAEFERMKQTMIRISSWLELAGAKIRSAETFITPISSASANHTLPEMTNWLPLNRDNISVSDVQRYLMHIRVYLEGDFSDPDPQLLPPLPYSLTIALQSSIQEREYKKYYKQKKSRRKRRKITVLVFLCILLVSVGIILLDQLFDIFHRF